MKTWSLLLKSYSKSGGTCRLHKSGHTVELLKLGKCDLDTSLRYQDQGSIDKKWLELNFYPTASLESFSFSNMSPLEPLWLCLILHIDMQASNAKFDLRPNVEPITPPPLSFSL